MNQVNKMQITCQQRDRDELHIESRSEGIAIKAIFDGCSAGIVLVGRTDALRLKDFIATEYPADAKPVAPGREYSFDGIGNKLLRIEPVPGSDQLVLNVCDSDGKHHIVMDKPEAIRLAQRLHWEYLFDETKASDCPAAATPQVTPVTPNWNDNPGTMVFGGDDDEKMEVSLAQENLTVALGHEADFGWEYVHLNQASVDRLIKHLQHCRHHMHGLVRVKEVGVHHPGHNQGRSCHRVAMWSWTCKVNLWQYCTRPNNWMNTCPATN